MLAGSETSSWTLDPLHTVEGGKLKSLKSAERAQSGKAKIRILLAVDRYLFEGVVKQCHSLPLLCEIIQQRHQLPIYSLSKRERWALIFSFAREEKVGDLEDLNSVLLPIESSLDKRPQKPKKPLKKKSVKKKSGKKFNKEYVKYIASDKWKLFRLSIIADRGKTCERCGTKKGTIQLHHLTYIRLENELSEDVQLLCLPCHETTHGRKFN